MHPYHFVAILGSDSEWGWAVLTGRSDGLDRREAFRNGHMRLSTTHPLDTTRGNINQRKRGKEGSNEKDSDCSRSGSGKNSLGTWYPTMAEVLKVSKHFTKEGKQCKE